MASSLSLVEGREKRRRKSTTTTVDGQAVLKLNDYTMDDGEPTLSGGRAEEPAKPKGACSAFTFFCKDARRDVAHLNFDQRAAQLGELWREVTAQERKKYDALAAKDRARFVRETASYEAELEEHFAAVEAAKEREEQAEWRELLVTKSCWPTRLRVQRQRESTLPVPVRHSPASCTGSGEPLR